jgi:hypothetical protein
VLQRDGVLVAHRLQMPGHHAGDGLDLGLAAEGPHALDFFGQHDVVVGDVRHDERAQRALAAPPDRAGGPGRQRRQEIQHAIAFLDEDLALAHRLDREEVQRFEASVAVRQQVDRRGQGGHREGRRMERVVHRHGSFL